MVVGFTTGWRIIDMKKSGLLRHVSMKPLFILSVAAALFAACGSGDGDENAVTQPETGENNPEGQLESSSGFGESSNMNANGIEYGLLTDARDGKIYKTVTIGSQTWMAENLIYEGGSFCFKKSADSCAKYGQLYVWYAAKNACPSGWHLPDTSEWRSLYLAMGNDPYTMQATGQADWPKATDAYGFSALPAGYYCTESWYDGSSANFWSSTKCDARHCSFGDFFYWNLDANSARFGDMNQICNLSVRCVQNAVISVVRGNMTDARDGKTYKTVAIDSQTWMAENLNYEVENSFCYNNSVDSCAKYGRLYTWAAAVGMSEEKCGKGNECGLAESIRGVCPEGWHLPDKYEWQKLYSTIERNPYAMQATGWTEWPKATDAYGFSALPVGVYYGYFYNAGFYAYFWSASERNNDYAYRWYLGTAEATLDSHTKDDGFSVRCIQDDP